MGRNNVDITVIQLYFQPEVVEYWFLCNGAPWKDMMHIMHIMVWYLESIVVRYVDWLRSSINGHVAVIWREVTYTWRNILTRGRDLAGGR